MLKAAIYARKSTDDNDRNEDNKSVIRQVEHSRSYAESRGWTVDEEYIFVDDGISGADFTKRKGLLQLLTKLKEFDIIIMSELSRLGREQIQTSKVLADIHAKEVRVFFYLTDAELNYDTAVDKFLVNAISFAAELEREKASQRSRDALERKAKKGYNTGGIIYGYDNVPAYGTNGKGEQVRSHTEFKINEEQANVIRSIYLMYADGSGHTTIAKTMNGDPRYHDKNLKYFGGKTPSSPRKGTGSWAPSSIRAILYNDRYVGQISFGKYRNAYRNGAKQRIKQEDYQVIDVEHLRIIPKQLWDEVRARLKSVAKTYIRDTNGKLWGRPGMGRESKYLLTGLGHCSCCGSNITILGGRSGLPGKRKPIYYYGCSYYQNRGTTVCANNHKIKMDILDAAVLEAIENQVLTPDAITYTVEKALALVVQRLKDDPNRPPTIESELSKLRRELNRFMQLIAAGQAPESVLIQIKQREQRISELERELVQLKSTVPTELNLMALKKALRARLGQFNDLIYSDVPKARQALRKLLTEPIQFTPEAQDGCITYSFEGKTRIGALLDPGYIGMASPRGFEPLLPP